MNTKRKITAGLLAWGVLTQLSASTTIVANPGGGTNATISDDFGDGVTASSSAFTVSGGGTPNIDLTWSAVKHLKVDATQWEFHNWAPSTTAGGGVLQLNGSGGSSTGNADPFIRNDVHQITVTPDGGYGVVVTSFNLTGDTNGDTYQYNWRLVRKKDAAVVASGKTVKWTTNGALQFDGAPRINVNYTGASGEELMLELAQSIGSTGNDTNSAMDNLVFSQTTPPYNPSAILGLGGFSIVLTDRK